VIPIPKHLNLTSILRSVFSNIHFNIVLLKHTYPKLFLSLRISLPISRNFLLLHKSFNRISKSPYFFQLNTFRWQDLHQGHSLHFYTPCTSHSQYLPFTIRKQPSFMHFPPKCPFLFFSFGSDIPHSTLFSHTLTLSFKVTDKQHTYETKKIKA
jgi:hypothetical protein